MMTIYSLLRQLFQGTSADISPAIAGICGPEELEKALRRERSRADRTAGEFAVITFSSGDADKNPDSLSPLIEHLQANSRSIDELGWNHDGTLWHILPHCSEKAAGNIASGLSEKFSTQPTRISYTLYHYSAQRPGLPVESPAVSNHISPAEANRQKSRSSTNNLSVSGASRSTCSKAPIKAAVSIDRLLERPMPSWKRLIDLVGSATGIVLLSPVFAAIALAIKWTSPGPVLFVQVRSGRGGRPFRMYKFRSMVRDAEERKRFLLPLNEQDGPAFKMENDPRVTPLGRFLRASSLDELPQLWNVLRGEMSLVGPRPLPLEESAACENWQRERLDVTPGLTCFWQIKDRRAKIPFVDWARMDIQYAGRQSPGLDLYLIARTLLFVLRRKGV